MAEVDMERQAVQTESSTQGSRMSLGGALGPNNFVRDGGAPRNSRSERIPDAADFVEDCFGT
ncbi:hypothetical protein [Bradyrhizobium tunisiense]|uniref:hypothetical protein n=1 Tax=Bradyrhizobium tunisiense TaxID=3278709 RepID=UPI0035D86081